MAVSLLWDRGVVICRGSTSSALLNLCSRSPLSPSPPLPSPPHSPLLTHTHTHREPLSALTGRPGSKRVTNYMRRCDEAAAARHLLSREELELLDVQRGMEEQLNEQYKQVGGWLGWYLDGPEGGGI